MLHTQADRPMGRWGEVAGSGCEKGELVVSVELGALLQNNLASRTCASFSNGVASWIMGERGCRGVEGIEGC